jgi:hypothetical protein
MIEQQARWNTHVSQQDSHNSRILNVLGLVKQYIKEVLSLRHLMQLS